MVGIYYHDIVSMMVCRAVSGPNMRHNSPVATSEVHPTSLRQLE